MRSAASTGIPPRFSRSKPSRALRLLGCAWIDKGVGYTVVAPVPPAELDHLAAEVRRQLDAAT